MILEDHQDHVQMLSLILRVPTIHLYFLSHVIIMSDRSAS